MFSPKGRNIRPGVRRGSSSGTGALPAGRRPSFSHSASSGTGGASAGAGGGSGGAGSRDGASLYSEESDAGRGRDEGYGAGTGSRRQTSSMGFGRRKDQVQIPTDIPELLDGVKVDVCVRCRPMFPEEAKAGDRVVLKAYEHEASVKIKPTGAHGSSERYFYDHTFGPDCTQERLYNTAAKPIVNNVLKGMNCCMFAYGQTGTGKTYTMVGDLRDEKHAGIIPRSARDIFSQLEATGGPYKVALSYLEVYNEQLTDLLIPPEASRPLKLVEDPRRGVVCQNLTEVPVLDAEEVYSLVASGNRRCQVASTNMNERSNRAHRIFILTVAFTKSPALSRAMKAAESILATKRPAGAPEFDEFGCLTIVDLAGSECVGRSGATEGRLIEAGNINKSLLTLGRVINALANNEPRIPYRDSKLTRLTAEALGGRCKTAIIATVSPGNLASAESTSTLKYAERARAALNATQLSKSQVLEAKLGRLSQLYTELQAEMLHEREAFEQERKLVQRTHDQQLEILRQDHQKEVASILAERDRTFHAQSEAIKSIQRSESVFLRSSRKGSSKMEATLARELQSIAKDAEKLKETMLDWNHLSSERLVSQGESMATLVKQLSSRLQTLSSSIQGQVDKSVSTLAGQRRALEKFAASEVAAMKKTSEEMIQRLAKVLSRHTQAHAARVSETMKSVLVDTSEMIEDTTAISRITDEVSSSLATSVVDWSKEASQSMLTIGRAGEEKLMSCTKGLDDIRDNAEKVRVSATTQLRELYSSAVHHNAVTDAETRKVASQLSLALHHHGTVHEPGFAESRSPRHDHGYGRSETWAEEEEPRQREPSSRQVPRSVGTARPGASQQRTPSRSPRSAKSGEDGPSEGSGTRSPRTSPRHVSRGSPRPSPKSSPRLSPRSSPRAPVPQELPAPEELPAPATVEDDAPNGEASDDLGTANLVDASGRLMPIDETRSTEGDAESVTAAAAAPGQADTAAAQPPIVVVPPKNPHVDSGIDVAGPLSPRQSRSGHGVAVLKSSRSGATRGAFEETRPGEEPPLSTSSRSEDGEGSRSDSSPIDIDALEAADPPARPALAQDPNPDSEEPHAPESAADRGDDGSRDASEESKAKPNAMQHSVGLLEGLARQLSEQAAQARERASSRSSNHSRPSPDMERLTGEHSEPGQLHKAEPALELAGCTTPSHEIDGSASELDRNPPSAH